MFLLIKTARDSRQIVSIKKPFADVTIAEARRAKNNRPCGSGRFVYQLIGRPFSARRNLYCKPKPVRKYPARNARSEMPAGQSG